MILKKKASNFLQPIREVTFPARASIDIQDLYKKTTALCVGDGFRYRILSAAKSSVSFGMKVTGFDLMKSLTPMEVRSMLPELHVFENPGVFCVQLADMITKQSDGQDGVLTSSGRTNIFYVRGIEGQIFAVECLWDKSSIGWFLQAYQLNEFKWDSGSRVFSNTAL